VINDGELSKPGYSTYIADRLSGFEGHEPAKSRLDTGPYPNFMAAYERMTGPNTARRAVCVGPIAVKDEEPLKDDIANLKAALCVRRHRGAGSGCYNPPAITRATKPMSRRSPLRCSRNTRPSSTPGLSCSLIAPISRWRTTRASRN